MFHNFQVLEELSVMTMETITAKKIDMRFDECYIKDVEEN